MSAAPGPCRLNYCSRRVDESAVRLVKVQLTTRAMGASGISCPAGHPGRRFDRSRWCLLRPSAAYRKSKTPTLWEERTLLTSASPGERRRLPLGPSWARIHKKGLRFPCRAVFSAVSALPLGQKKPLRELSTGDSASTGAERGGADPLFCHPRGRHQSEDGGKALASISRLLRASDSAGQKLLALGAARSQRTRLSRRGRPHGPREQAGGRGPATSGLVMSPRLRTLYSGRAGAPARFRGAPQAIRRPRAEYGGSGGALEDTFRQALDGAVAQASIPAAILAPPPAVERLILIDRYYPRYFP
ncbi:hypothetical protein NDU88_006641 [Pleurodeles waltl]|uniref:Uncharacterized protein n=1 Tax=Pleurodeles waltl TaxID=8319 RepID=A0AAV7RSF6_PLEWA|nr:hypothetical protein NDU88_006641 [Pleurodeles waltl]